MQCSPIYRSLLLALVSLAFGGCAAQRAYREASDLMAQDRVEAGLHKYQEAVAADPENVVYRLGYLRARDDAILRLLLQADRALAVGNGVLARQGYQRVLSIAPRNERAMAGLHKVESARRHSVALKAATDALGKDQYALARQKLEEVLSEQPDDPAALALMERVKAASQAPSADIGLADAFRNPISLEFREASVRQVFEAISQHAGLNFVFDKDVRSDLRTSIFLKNSTVEAAINYLLMTNQLDRQIMDGNTILIYPNTPDKQKDYQEMTVKAFYLANADAKSVAGSLKTILKLRDIAVDEKLNLVMVRDSIDAVRLAGRMVALLDVPEPEVVLDVEVMEVQRSRMTELGVAWPTSLSLAPLATSSGNPLTIDELRGLNSSRVGVGGIAAMINAHKEDGDSATLANPRIRVRNREKAKVVIGDKLPTITTTVSPGTGGFASESVNYVDVGLTLNVEPTIHLDNEVAIKISLEVSNLVDSMTTKSGSVVYRIGTRSATTLLQLKDGENQVLAGLIQNEDRSSGSKVPILGDLPLLGRLFGSTNDSNGKTEIVLSITPHLVRNIQRPPADQAEFASGTDTIVRQRPLIATVTPSSTLNATPPAGAPTAVVPTQQPAVGTSSVSAVSTDVSKPILPTGVPNAPTTTALDAK